MLIIFLFIAAEEKKKRKEEELAKFKREKEESDREALRIKEMRERREQEIEDKKRRKEQSEEKCIPRSVQGNNSISIDFLFLLKLGNYSKVSHAVYSSEHHQEDTSRSNRDRARDRGYRGSPYKASDSAGTIIYNFVVSSLLYSTYNC